MPFKRILVALNGEPEGEQALEAAIALASALESHVQAVAVEGRLPKYASTIGEVDDAKQQKDAFLETVTRQAQAHATEAGIELDVEYAAGAPTDAITRVARRDDCDLIVVGYHKHLFGGLADHLSHHAPCPVLVIRGKHE